MTEHHCHALGCDRPCAPERLMCVQHWKRVPAAQRQEVWNHYREGQCRDKNPSLAWLIAARRAICSVAIAEGRMTPAEAEERLAHLESLRNEV